MRTWKGAYWRTTDYNTIKCFHEKASLKFEDGVFNFKLIEFWSLTWSSMLDSCKDLVRLEGTSIVLNCTVHSTPTLEVFARQH